MTRFWWILFLGGMLVPARLPEVGSMSEYGKIFEKIARVREELKRRVPGIGTNTLAEARAGVDILESLLAEWERLEKLAEKME